MNSDLFKYLTLIFEPLKCQITHFSSEAESQEYDACTFDLDDKKVVYRTSKITPTKTGQFVTLWKRISGGSIQPFEVSDALDIVIIHTRKEEKAGLFMFPKSILAEKGIITTASKEGKRGFRVYPPWDTTTNKQAQKSQDWQNRHFVNLYNRYDGLSKNILIEE